MVLETLQRMAAGGIHDHLGGGFHRYSVDRSWHVPHFEKMLYDQAQLAIAYLETCQMSGGEEQEAIIRDILDYVRRDMPRGLSLSGPRRRSRRRFHPKPLLSSAVITACLPGGMSIPRAIRMGNSRARMS
jgi:hypothetical protein